MSLVSSMYSREHGDPAGMACETNPSKRRHRVTRALVVAGLLSLASLLTTLGISVATATAAPGLVWGSVSEVGPPASAPSGERMLLTEVSCAAAGDCVAIGTLEPKHELQALVVEETNGVWGKAAFVELPEASKVTYSQLESIDCPAVGDCTAVGYDEVVAAKPQAIVVSESNGSWGTAQVIQQPATSASAKLASVACTGPGSCIAVGESKNSSTLKDEAVAVTQTNETWTTAVAVPQPADATPNGGLDSVSCPAAGECAATGWYQSETAHAYEAMGANDVNGTWTSEGIMLPSKAEYVRLYVACPTSGSCGASGFYYESFPTSQAITASYADGKWSSNVGLIDSEAGDEYPYLGAPSCPASGSCVAAGAVYVSAEKEYEPLVASATAGVWGSGGTVSLPSNALTEAEAQTLEDERDGELYSVSCWAVGVCEAVGGFMDQKGEFAPMVASETGGVWSQAEEIAPPSNAATSEGEAWLSGVSCTASGACGGAGSYIDNADEYRGMTASAAIPPPVSNSNPPTSPVITLNGPAKSNPPVITIDSSKLKVVNHKLQVKLACLVSTCKGVVKVVAVVKVRVRHKGKTVTKKRTVGLASGDYKIAGGKTQTIEIKLTATGRKLLAKLAKHHTLNAKLIVTVKGGATYSKTVKLS